MQAISDAAVDGLLRDGAWAMFSVSGGKDSTAAMHAATVHLDRIGHPKDRRLAIHADLGRAEWRSTHEHVARVCDTIGVPLQIVKHRTHDLVSRWARRGELSHVRYVEYDTVRMFGPWSGSGSLFCRSEIKTGVIDDFKARMKVPVVGIVGLRRAESTGRRHTPIHRIEESLSVRVGHPAMLWHPIAEWETQAVYDYHREHDLHLHEAYGLGSTRLSCAFCVLASKNDLGVSADVLANRDLYRMLVDMESGSAFSFQPTKWLADVAPHMLTAEQIHASGEARLMAAERRRIESGIPNEMAYKRNAPIVIPSRTMANAMAAVRREVSLLYGLESRYLDADSIIEKHHRLAAPKEVRPKTTRKRGRDLLA